MYDFMELYPILDVGYIGFFAKTSLKCYITSQSYAPSWMMDILDIYNNYQSSFMYNFIERCPILDVGYFGFFTTSKHHVLINRMLSHLGCWIYWIFYNNFTQVSYNFIELSPILDDGYIGFFTTTTNQASCITSKNDVTSRRMDILDF